MFSDVSFCFDSLSQSFLLRSLFCFPSTTSLQKLTFLREHDCPPMRSFRLWFVCLHDACLCKYMHVQCPRRVNITVGTKRRQECRRKCKMANFSRCELDDDSFRLLFSVCAPLFRSTFSQLAPLFPLFLLLTTFLFYFSNFSRDFSFFLLFSFLFLVLPFFVASAKAGL